MICVAGSDRKLRAPRGTNATGDGIYTYDHAPRLERPRVAAPGH